MPAHKETNIRLPYCALEALAAIRTRWGTSRDEAVRRLLADHVEAQEQLESEDRLTHISTVLRYPPPPRWRRDPRQDLPLRLRAPADLLERARAVSLMLPGQYQRAYRDYQGRALTDAVTTAIWHAEPFTDEFLDGLLPVLRHGSALGLWRLITVTTGTKPEKELLREAETIRARRKHQTQALPDDEAVDERYLLLAAEALERDVGWHSPARFQAAANLARHVLTGPRAKANEQALYDQDRPWSSAYRQALLATNPPPRAWGASSTYDWSGRGGTAVWRAYRKTELQDFEEWLVDREETDPAERDMTPPGWLIRTPATWRAHAPASTAQQLPEPYATWAAAGRVLAFPYKSRQAIWPLQGCPGGWEPVPGIEPLTAAAAGLRPDRISGFIEAVLVEWNHEFAEEPPIRIALFLPADKACAFGLITVEEQHEAMAQARAATRRRMDAVIDAFKDGGLEEHRLRQLQEARSSGRLFRRLAVQFGRQLPGRRPGGMYIGSDFYVSRAAWQWPGRSMAGELLAGTPGHLVEGLATAAHGQCGLILEQSMQIAWQRAFDRYGRRV
ncbi:hypothetical protein [Kitasatospora sp. KL5]|uniref:hypothetical protein n=1 Tax=Kitasatospora sp. KL5 TaxID=3425125 RepID=UPI003D6DB617